MASTASPAVTGPILTLNNGVKIPAFGFGTFAHDGSEGETHAAVLCALNAGYRHLDCAWFYQNEREVGSAVREFLASNPSVKREDIFICTKVWPHLFEPADVEWSIKNSLEKLQTPYIDAFLLHWPFAVEKTEKNADGNYMPLIGADGAVCFCYLPPLYSFFGSRLNTLLTSGIVRPEEGSHRKSGAHVESNGEALQPRPRKVHWCIQLH